MKIGALARKAGAASTVAIGASALALGTALPGHAADEADGGVAKASALEAEVSGQVVSDKMQAAWNGKEQVSDGVESPELPELVTGGALSQDALGNEYFSAACAGLVGSGAEVSLESDGTCTVDNNGKVEVSLGTLPQLGVEDLLSKLPDAPDVPDVSHILDGLPLPELSASLPDADLRIVGQAITARCAAEPNGAEGDSTTTDLELVADVAGEVVVLGNITKQDGLTLGHTELLNKIAKVLPAESKGAVDKVVSKLEQLPTDQVSDKVPQLTELISIQTDMQRPTPTGVDVTALEANVAAPATPGVLDGLPNDAVNNALGDKLDGVTGQLGNLTGTLTGDDLRNADLGPAAVRVGHVNCIVPTTAGPDSEDTVDVETKDAPGTDASSQGNPNQQRLDLTKVTGEVKQLLTTVESVADAL